MYRVYHQRVLEAVERVLPIEAVCSIDEMRCRLIGDERAPSRACELASKIKKEIRETVGECMTCSVGVAPNPFLAKLGTELQKPDGLVIIQAEELPGKLFALKLTDFTGINRRMEVRLNAAGIFTAEQLCTADRPKLHEAFGSIVGEQWWYLLRGYDLPAKDVPRKTLGHSHVLRPSLRTDQGVREVLIRLLQKAAARLRQESLFAGGMIVAVGGFERSWKATLPLPPTQDSVKLNEALLKAWENRNFLRPKIAAITFYDLRPPEGVTPSLFGAAEDRSALNHAVDDLNRRFGKNTVYIAAMKSAKDVAEERIAFNKTWLFSEGKGDNEWLDTFRGPG
jgi:DNA polymerase-4